MYNRSDHSPLERIQAWRVILSVVGWIVLLGFVAVWVVGLAGVLDSIKGGIL